jgi:hypothetical protein
MSDYKRLFLIANGEVAMVQNEFGESATFESIADLNRCTGMDFSGKFKVNYEPEKNIFIDSRDETFNEHLIPYQPYEDLIDIVLDLQARKNDPLYGLSGQELVDAQAWLDAQNEYEQALATIEAEQAAAGVTQYTPEQVRAYIDNQLAGASTNEEKFQVLVAIIKKLAVFVLKPDPPSSP